MHYWGDEWPYWNELYEAEDWIAKYVYRWSRCRLQSKEKWGTIRYEYIWPPAYRGCGPIIKVPFIKRKISIGSGHFITNYYILYWTDSWLYYKWRKLGCAMLRRAIKKACIKFPNVNKEITVGLEWENNN